MVHDVAAAGFNDPQDYEAARPSYPDDALAWFATQASLEPGRRVVDLAAGTGKFTRLLVGTGADVVACEPVPGMRATFRSVLPGVPVFAGTAEALPLRGASIDVITVAQAWHWFDHDRAATEAARVVRAGGALALLWNARDRSIPWVDEVWSIMDRVEKRAPWRDHENWRDSAVREMPGFGPMESAEFHHRQPMTPDGVVQRPARGVGQPCRGPPRTGAPSGPRRGPRDPAEPPGRGGPGGAGTRLSDRLPAFPARVSSLRQSLGSTRDVTAPKGMS
jgi:SAM-dependent methyltransferase